MARPSRSPLRPPCRRGPVTRRDPRPGLPLGLLRAHPDSQLPLGDHPPPARRDRLRDRSRAGSPSGAKPHARVLARGRAGDAGLRVPAAADRRARVRARVVLVGVRYALILAPETYSQRLNSSGTAYAITVESPECRETPSIENAMELDRSAPRVQSPQRVGCVQVRRERTRPKPLKCLPPPSRLQLTGLHQVFPQDLLSHRH